MAERGGTRHGQSDDVTASEAATYAFCAKAWHLERVLGKRPSPQAAERRARGIRQHREHGESMVARPRGWTRSRAVMLTLLLLGIVAVIVVLTLHAWRIR